MNILKVIIEKIKLFFYNLLKKIIKYLEPKKAILKCSNISEGKENVKFNDDDSVECKEVIEKNVSEINVETNIINCKKIIES